MIKTDTNREQPSKYELLDRLVGRAEKVQAWTIEYNRATNGRVPASHPMLLLLIRLMDGLIDHIGCPVGRWEPFIINGKPDIQAPHDGPTFILTFSIDVGDTKMPLAMGIKEAIDNKYDVSLLDTHSLLDRDREKLESFTEFYEKVTARMQELALESLWKSK